MNTPPRTRRLLPLLVPLVLVGCTSSSSGSDDDGPGGNAGVSVEFSIPSSNIIEGQVQVIAQVQLSDIAEEDVIVNFFSSGSATNFVDFEVQTDSPITIPTGSVTQNIVIDVFADTLGELDEIVRLQIFPANADVGPNNTYTLTIVDDDATHFPEDEPNDDPSDPDVVGDIQSGIAYVITGKSLVGEFDFFQLTATDDVDVLLFLDPDSAVSQVVLGVYDDSGTLLDVFDDDQPGTTVSGIFSATAGQVFLLGVAVEGAGTDYTLTGVGVDSFQFSHDGPGSDEMVLAARGFGADRAGWMEWRRAQRSRDTGSSD